MFNLKSKGVRVSAGLLAGAVLLWASGIAPQAYNLIQTDSGNVLPRASTLKFHNTASVTWVCSTAAGVTTCSSTATGGAGGITGIEANGTPLPAEPTLNLIDGTNTTVSCADNPGNTSTDCQTNASGGGSGGFIQPLTAPVHGNFTQINYNAGGTTTAEVDNSTPVPSITIQQADATTSLQIVGNTKAKLAATFTVTVGLSLSGNPSTQPLAGLWLTDATPANNLFICFHQFSGGILRIPVFSNLSGTFSTDVVNATATIWPQGPLIWFRIQETASARNYYTSSDGVTFNLLVTESNTAHFTTANYGWGITTRDGAVSGTTGVNSVTLYSFTETNP